ncbi:PREDICTED: uncharacterized protein LOC105853456 [Condylura cristata]|uniref:uncharacterized protein LOC105853456 n=1 Tax=Condylura cristata TaxID=143302 RepID=UPI000643A4C8|nr:PREDICTED: uncharacterized protein LOC105853456 [Condylura cristata]
MSPMTRGVWKMMRATVMRTANPRFAHQFLDPGTYLFQDNGLPESMAVVLVKKGVACDPGLSPMQPSSPYQLTRHGIFRHHLPNLGPNWIAITGGLLTVGLATMLLIGLGLALRPQPAQAYPIREWRSQWRELRETHTEYSSLKESFPFHEDHGPRGSGKRVNSRGEAVSPAAGKPFPSNALDNFSVRTLYDKLEDQNLHVATQLSQHRRDALAFYRGAIQQLQGLKEHLQGLPSTEQQVLGRSQDMEMRARAAAGTSTGQSEGFWGDHSASSQREFWPYPGDASVCPLGFQSELQRVTTALASALHHALKPPTGDDREAAAQIDGQLLSTCHHDPHLMSDKTQPLLSYEEPQSASSQKDQRPAHLPQGDNKGDVEGSQEWSIWAAPGYRAFPELQRKIQQTEDMLDELNEEFFQLSSQTLELQKEDKPGRPTLSDDSTLLREEPNPRRKAPGAWVMLCDQALVLEVRRAHLAERIRDLEWELSLFLEVSDGQAQAGGCLLSLGGH